MTPRGAEIITGHHSCQVRLAGNSSRPFARSHTRRVTGQTAEEVYGKRRAFSEAWVQRPDFLNFYGAKTNSEFVDSLLGRYGLTAVNTDDPANFDGDAPLVVRLTRNELVAALDCAAATPDEGAGVARRRPELRS